MYKKIFIFIALILFVFSCDNFNLVDDIDVKKISHQIEDINQNKNDNLSKDVLRNIPSRIMYIVKENGIIYFDLELLEYNPNFLPGISDFFIENKSQDIKAYIDKNTKSYNCSGVPDGTKRSADILVDLDYTINNIENWLLNEGDYPIYYFDIDDDYIENIYEQCLP